MECSEYTLFLNSGGGQSCESIGPKNEMKESIVKKKINIV